MREHGGAEHGHEHGEPRAWDPRAGARGRGIRYVWLGLALIAAGLALVWLASARGG